MRQDRLETHDLSKALPQNAAAMAALYSAWAQRVGVKSWFGSQTPIGWKDPAGKYAVDNTLPVTAITSPANNTTITRNRFAHDPGVGVRQRPCHPRGVLRQRRAVVHRHDVAIQLLLVGSERLERVLQAAVQSLR